MREPRLPGCISKFCRETIPLLHGSMAGGRMLSSVRAIVETDRWNSFDRFHDTTRTICAGFERAGAATEVYGIQTGGVPGSGRWTIHEAEDVIEATADIVTPIRRRLVDYRKNPWQLVQWSTSTPVEGMTCPLVTLDSKEEYDRVPPGGLLGKMVLTRRGREAGFEFFKKGAVGLIYDLPVRDLPGATAWAKFSWGSIKIDEASGRLVGLSISAQEGDRLRRLIRERGPVTLRVRVNVRRYVGSHDVVSGLIAGGGDPQDEVLGHRPQRRTRGGGQRIRHRRVNRDRPGHLQAGGGKAAAARASDDPPVGGLRVLRILQLPGESRPPPNTDGGPVRGWRRRQAGLVRPGVDLARNDSHVRRVRERHRRRHGARRAARGQPRLSFRDSPLSFDARHPVGRPGIWFSLSVHND